MEPNEPRRPEGVPEDARWVPADQEWELGALDSSGLKQGPFTYWRSDGSKCNECFLIDGQPHGTFRRFHPNGELAQEGQFVDGVLHGTRRWFASSSPTPERMHEGGVSEAVRKSEMDYVEGRVVAVRHYDEGGRRVTPKGDAYPARPAAVDEDAEYRPDDGLWTLGQADGETAVRVGPWRTWSAGGQLLEEAGYRDGERHGPARLWFVGTSPFADPRIRSEAGELYLGRRVGRWQLLDEAGQPVATVEYGPADSLGLDSLEAWANVGASDWDAKGAALIDAGAVAAALVTLARACVIARSTGPLTRAMAGRRVVLTQMAADELAEEAAGELEVLATALVSGASVGPVLGKLAIVLNERGRSRAALDFVNAALLFAPSASDHLFTRALVLVNLGLKEQAEKDAGELAASSPEEAEFLLDYLRFLFPVYGFWPESEKPHTTYDGLPEAPVKHLEEVQAVVQKYATRLMQIRQRLLAQVSPGVRWLPPELPQLLPGGPVRLDAGELEVVDPESGPKMVQFDERLVLEELDLPGLLRAARADWNALTWLLWSAGETGLAMPAALRPPPDFALAAGMSAQRLWRARDQRACEGKNARAHGVAGFEWEGVDIGDLNPDLAGIAEQQYAEMQALFYWLSRDDVRTPWQEELRGS